MYDYKICSIRKFCQFREERASKEKENIILNKILILTVNKILKIVNKGIKQKNKANNLLM